MSANYTYSHRDKQRVEYVKTTHCSSGCTWYSDVLVLSIHGQALVQTEQPLVGKLHLRRSRQAEPDTGHAYRCRCCTTRIYPHDAYTNRLSLTTREPGVGGPCAAEGGIAQPHAYDGAAGRPRRGFPRDAGQHHQIAGYLMPGSANSSTLTTSTTSWPVKRKVVR